MLDWRALVFNSLWVFAAALELAAFSHAAWAAPQRSVKLNRVLREPGYQFAFNLAGFLFCLGLAGLAQGTWRILAWLVLSGVFLIQIGLELYHASQAKPK